MKWLEENIPNSVIVRPDFDCGSPTCNYRVVECKLTTTNEIGRSASLHSNLDKNNIDSEQIGPTTVSITIPDEGKG